MRSTKLARVPLVLGMLGVLAVMAQPAKAAAGENVLRPGERLARGQELRNGAFKLQMQTDGNLVLREGTDVCWAAGSNTTDTRAFAVMQSDSNFVVYQYSGGPARWANGKVPGAGTNDWMLLMAGGTGQVRLVGVNGSGVFYGKLRNANC